MGSSTCGGGKSRPGAGVPAGEEAERPQEETSGGEQTAGCRAESKVSVALQPSAKLLALAVVTHMSDKSWASGWRLGKVQ